VAAFGFSRSSRNRTVGWIVVAILAAFLSTPVTLAQTSALTPPPYAAETIAAPPARPSAMLGAPIYQQNCALCHGVTGAGDGTQAAASGIAMRPLTDRATTWEVAPAEAFHLTKFGNGSSAKPAFQSFLNDVQLWQATFYAWSLHTDAEQVDLGAQRYADACARCHGVQGRGDGPEASPDLKVDFSDLRAMNVRSAAALDGGWRRAHPELGDDLSETERSTILDALRTFTYAPPWESPYQAGAGRIEGRLVQGSANAETPSNQEVSLMAYMNFTPVSVFTATTDAGGAFAFEQLATGPDVIYYVGSTYQDVVYGSDLFALSPLTPTLAMEIPVYETTTDASSVRFSRGQWVIDHVPGALRVRQFLIVANDHDRTVIGAPQAGSDRSVTVEVPLPPGAVGLALQDGALGARYVEADGRLFDTTPIRPGEQSRQISLLFELPYDGNEATLAASIAYPVDTFSLLVADLPNLSLAVSDWLEDVGNQTVQDVAYRVWHGALTEAGSLDLSLQNLIAAGEVDPRLAQAQNSQGVAPALTPPAIEEPGFGVPPLFASIAIGAVVLVIGASILLVKYSRDKAQTENVLRSERDRLLTAVAALDDRHAQGELDDETWSAERLVLMNRLRNVTESLDQMQPQRKRG
jgi:mono/diheme cytochrome c family protein